MNLDEARSTMTLTVAEVKELNLLRGMGTNQIYAACKKGEIPSVRIGGRVLILTQPLLAQLGLEDHGT